MASARGLGLSYLIWHIVFPARSLKRAHAELVRAQQLLGRIERQHEAERLNSGIAGQVYDELGGDLVKLVMLASEARTFAMDHRPAWAKVIEDIERIANEADRSLADHLWAIDPHHDSLAGLTDRVRAHCERRLKRSRLVHTIDCAHEGPDRSLDPATKRDIYLLLREAMENAINSVGARHIHVKFRTFPTGVDMEVREDGVGIAGDGGAIGQGLRTRRARAEHVGACIDVLDEGGTAVRLQLAFPG